MPNPTEAPDMVVFDITGTIITSTEAVADAFTAKTGIQVNFESMRQTLEKVETGELSTNASLHSAAGPPTGSPYTIVAVTADHSTSCVRKAHTAEPGRRDQPAEDTQVGLGDAHQYVVEAVVRATRTWGEPGEDGAGDDGVDAGALCFDDNRVVGFGTQSGG